MAAEASAESTAKSTAAPSTSFDKVRCAPVEAVLRGQIPPDAPSKAQCAEVLTYVQQSLPLQVRPYKALGKVCGVSERCAFDIVQEARASGVIRRIGASFESSQIGYAATLVAMAVDPSQIEHVAALVGRCPGITHNYERNAHYNLWFTLIAHSKQARDSQLAQLIEQTRCCEVLVLPTIRLFKIKVSFDVREKSGQALACGDQDSICEKGDQTPVCDGQGAVQGNISLAGSLDSHSPQAPIDTSHALWTPKDPPLEPARVIAVPLDDTDKALIRALQGDVGDFIRPFQRIAQVIAADRGVCPDEQWVVMRTRQLKYAGAIRRFGAMVRHQRMGFSYNVMGLWDIEDDQVLVAGSVLSVPPEVSHCYERPRQASWPYNLYTMIHGRSFERCETVSDELYAQLCAHGVRTQPPRLLLSTREFKKTSMRYFEEDL